jgi:hypothetical protein
MNPKHNIGAVVYVTEQRCTVTGARLFNAKWRYRVDNPANPDYNIAWWSESFLVTESEWEAKQETYRAGVAEREALEAERRRELETKEPQREGFASEQDYQLAFIEWAAGYANCGGMPSLVHSLYYQYMLAQRPTILW